jgi:hypothetical protein
VLVAHTVVGERVTMVGLQLAEPEPDAKSLLGRLKAAIRRMLAAFRA